MKKTCFVIMGFGKKTDSGETYDLDMTYKNIIKPAVEQCGIVCIRGDEIKDSSLIDKSMYALLVQTELVIADITTYNPNALYELGIRHGSRPYSTIIIKGNSSPIPFDINHNRIFHYKHGGEDIGKTEADRCVSELKDLIKSVLKQKETDSPLFEFIPSVKPHAIPEDEFSGIIKELAEKEKHLFGIVERAKLEMKSGNFNEAKAFWKKAHDNVENEPYFIQQYALSTYKSKTPSERTALQDALSIIKHLNPDDSNDPETLGITGAINKRLWVLDNDIEHLNRAIEYYRKGFQLNDDYYTGENYALCLDFMSKKEEDREEKIYYKIEAKRTREKIIKIIKDIFKEDGYQNRIDIKWIYATISICSFALEKEENYKKYKTLFETEADAEWEIETFQNSIDHITSLNN
ncbi:TRAFs-binding domain-containing protein [Aquimarina megaterium]|uniref:TRAFs-binding domain-containing protein n=1 Tax=Aquimarina megaterium TaxID=1443666 RepID=UPI0009F5F7A9|nr:TRAFs-binding domain-containing protein [Aquimarina megaterium]